MRALGWQAVTSRARRASAFAPATKQAAVRAAPSLAATLACARWQATRRAVAVASAPAGAIRGRASSTAAAASESPTSGEPGAEGAIGQGAFEGSGGAGGRGAEGGGGGGGHDDVDGPATSAGARFLRNVDLLSQRRQEIEAAMRPSAERQRLMQEIVRDPYEETKMQVRRLFAELPGHVSFETAFLLHKRKKLLPKVAETLDEQTFRDLFTSERKEYLNSRRMEVRRRRKARRNYARLNTGYSEADELHMPAEEEFMGDWRTASMVEDYWKAEYYQSMQHWLRESIPERERLAVRTDRVADIAGAAVRKHIAEQNRPVLTHELADFENAYMMKKSAVERILQERCVRNQLDERCMPRLIESMPDLVKLRSKAPLPPEVLEPLAAFRGDVRWNFDPQERLSQKLEAVDAALEALTDAKGSDALAAVTSVLPENRAVDADQVPGVHHPFRNHLGFESAVPHGVAGGGRFGQPDAELEVQLRRLRYPTLQRVAHTLPRDPKWRAHVVRSIRVLERSKHWDYQSKLRAVNTLKEVYDNMRPSAEYTEALDEKLPLNRVDSRLKRKYARNVEYVKTYPKNHRWKKTNTRYRQSLTATAPLKKSK